MNLRDRDEVNCAGSLKLSALNCYPPLISVTPTPRPSLNKSHTPQTPSPWQPHMLGAFMDKSSRLRKYLHHPTPPLSTVYFRAKQAAPDEKTTRFTFHYDAAQCFPAATHTNTNTRVRARHVVCIELALEIEQAGIV